MGANPSKRYKTVEQARKEFPELVRKTITSRDPEKLIRYILNTSYLTDPASGEYHNDFQGGLVEHCLNVNVMARDHLLPALKRFASAEAEKITEESMFLVAITHDFCKVGKYRWGEERNYKDSTTNGKWVPYTYYGFNQDEFPMGHGEKSLAIASELIKLSTEEMLAIRWHMHFTEMGVNFGESKFSFGAAFSNPLVKLMALADYSTNLLEMAIEHKTGEFRKSPVNPEFIEKLREI
jgi:hypothetical protein